LRSETSVPGNLSRQRARLEDMIAIMRVAAALWQARGYTLAMLQGMTMMGHLALAFVLLFPVCACAQDMNDVGMTGSGHAAHMAQMAAAASLPREAGQSAFAAIAEIVSMLEADPATDWTQVDIEALRQHLIDMNNVTLNAAVSGEPVSNGMRYSVTGEGAVQASIRRMVSAHVKMMDGGQGWRFSSVETAGGASLTVTAPDAKDLAKLKGLGLIGLLTLGMHHQRHHLMIASGHDPHH
jgi:hypothetical protein